MPATVCSLLGALEHLSMGPVLLSFVYSLSVVAVLWFLWIECKVHTFCIKLDIFLGLPVKYGGSDKGHLSGFYLERI